MSAIPGWRSPLIALAIIIISLLAIFHRDVADMASIWWNASTFTHCLFIIPISAWLVWQREEEVSALTPRSWPPGLALIALGGFVWVIGEAAGVALFRHAALVFMIQASVLTLLGPKVTRGLLFPLFYLCFLVPFGEEFVPQLQTITAKLTIALLGVSGIPFQVDGVFIRTQSGLFEVAEACSGVKFLVAMVAYGALAANVCFKSWPRRAAFMVLCVIVPILANGVRAFGTIYISELTSIAFAASVDHVVYGWFFFAFVMILVMAISWKFFDRGINDPWIPDVKPDEVKSRPPRIGLVVAAVAIAFAPMAWQTAVASSGRSPMPNEITLPDVPGWQGVPIVQTFPWWPRFDGADHRTMVQYQNAQGARVELAVAVFAWQEEKREIVGYGQGAYDPDTRWAWTSNTSAPNHGQAVRIMAPGVAREVASFYVLGGLTTGDPFEVKIETLKNRLLGGDQAAVAVLVSAEDSAGKPSRTAIDAFLKDLGPVELLAARVVKTARGKPS